MKTNTIGRSAANQLHDLIDSTNTRLANLAKEGAPEGTVALARQQTAGRGRLGRQWVSPPDSGLYMSVLLRPQQSVAELPVITLGIGVAAAKAIFAITGVSIGLKWVNDLIYDGKKIGGILAEMPSSDGDRRVLIIGIGINVRFACGSVPDQLKHKMIWLEAASGTECDTSSLAAELCYQIEQVYLSMNGNGKTGVAKILDEWRAFSVTLGHEIICTTPAREVRGTAVDISESGALIVETPEGREELLGGEITIRSADGSYA